MKVVKKVKGNGKGSQLKGRSKVFDAAYIGVNTTLTTKDCYRATKLSNGSLITFRSGTFYPTVFPCNKACSTPMPTAGKFHEADDNSDETNDSKTTTSSSNGPKNSVGSERKIYSEDTDDSDDEELPPRRSTRVTAKPQAYTDDAYVSAKMHDQSHTAYAGTGQQRPTEKKTDASDTNSTQLPKNRLGQTLLPTTPTCAHDVKNSWDKKQWIEAIVQGARKHQELGTHKLVPRPGCTFCIQRKFSCASTKGTCSISVSIE